MKQFALVGAASIVIGIAILFAACIGHEDLTCYDATGNIVYKEQHLVQPFQVNQQWNLEKFCANRGYNSASLVRVDIFGYHKQTYFYGCHAGVDCDVLIRR